MMNGKMLITGATGFVGREVIRTATRRGLSPVAAVRQPDQRYEFDEAVVVGAIDRNTDWMPALTGCETVVHLAARVHVMAEGALDPLMEFRRTNVEGTMNLVRQAISAGVRRFVYVSTVKVHGEKTLPGLAFSSKSVYAPHDAYAISKMEAEVALLRLAKTSGLQLVIVRPPLVYGPGAKANFAAMVRAVSAGLPLPLGCVTQNRRSFVGLDNLVDLLLICVNHSNAAGRAFLVADGEDISTAELVIRMGRALGRAARLWPVPVAALRWAASLAGRSSMTDRLCDSLRLDIRETEACLDWHPPISMDEGLRRMAGKS